MRASLHLQTPTAAGKLNPFLDRPSQRHWTDVVRTFIVILQAMVGGFGMKRTLVNGTRETVSMEYGQDAAFAGITVAAPADAATVTLNGQAMTGHQHRASGTVTFASAQDGDTVTVNGVVFTGKTAPSGNYQFAVGVTDTADAAAFIAKVNTIFAATNDANGAGVTGLIEGKSAVAVATVYAIAEGTAGNAYTLASSNNSRLAVSGATLANGAAATNNEFDRIGNDKRTARSICTNLGLSSTAILNKHVTAACRAGTVTCASVNPGDSVSLDYVKLIATKSATDVSNGGARDAKVRDELFSTANSDTNCAVSLCNAINNHPKLRERFYATNSSGVVSIYERPPESTLPPPLSSSGSTLAVTNTTNGCLADSAHVFVQSLHPGHGGNAVTIATSSGSTLAIDGSASRLANGTSTTVSL